MRCYGIEQACKLQGLRQLLPVTWLNPAENSKVPRRDEVLETVCSQVGDDTDHATECDLHAPLNDCDDTSSCLLLAEVCLFNRCGDMGLLTKVAASTAEMWHIVHDEFLHGAGW